MLMCFCQINLKLCHCVDSTLTFWIMDDLERNIISRQLSKKLYMLHNIYYELCNAIRFGTMYDLNIHIFVHPDSAPVSSIQKPWLWFIASISFVSRRCLFSYGGSMKWEWQVRDSGRWAWVKLGRSTTIILTCSIPRMGTRSQPVRNTKIEKGQKKRFVNDVFNYRKIQALQMSPCTIYKRKYV